MKVAYSTGFWSTNIGNGFFSLGVEYVLKKLLGAENVTLVSDLQTYTNAYGKRYYIHSNQLEFYTSLDVDYIVLAGPVLSKYFIPLWKDILLALQKRGIGYMLLSAGVMKLNATEEAKLVAFLKECPPYVLTSRDSSVYKRFSEYATHSYDGICFSFFAPDYYSPCSMSSVEPYIALNFDKINEPMIWLDKNSSLKPDQEFELFNNHFKVKHAKATKIAMKTDRFTDALIYATSFLPAPKRPDNLEEFRIIRTDHRFHPHFRRKIYRYNNSFCADLPFSYINIYANAACTFSDRIHACAVTLAFGNYAMLFSKTDRLGLLDRVGAESIRKEPIKIDLNLLSKEKKALLNWMQKFCLVR